MAYSDHRIPGPAVDFAAVTPSDVTALTPGRALYVGGSGNLVVKAPGNATAVTFSGVPGGMLLPIATQYVMATGTTATNIVIVY